MEISTPGRICLFGEHQDYLGLPVISMAISLRARIAGKKRANREIIIHKPDINETETFSLDDLAYSRPRDYFKSGFKVCKDAGLAFSRGFECELISDIPIQAGTGSSSAIMVSWIHFLSQMADEPVYWDQQNIGSMAYKAEVVEFNEPGGMMDQYSTAIGHLIYLESEPEILIRSLNTNLGTFVLGDSCEPKDTMGILQRCRDARLNIIEKLKKQDTGFDLHGCGDDVDLSYLNEEEKSLFQGTIKNRDLFKQALAELEKDEPDHELVGQLLSEHHTVLKDVLQVSTPKIETMLAAAMKAGALGGKINGSGGGGCMFVYCPENPQAAADAIEEAGGNPYIIKPDEGTRID